MSDKERMIRKGIYKLMIERNRTLHCIDDIVKTVLDNYKESA